MKYNEFLEKFSSKEYTGIKPGLERIEKACGYFGNPQNFYPVIHVAGTNGKGSTVAILSRIFINSGYVTGTYVSPHLIDIRERIMINGRMISKNDIEDTLKFIISSYKEVSELTFFELITLIAFIYFKNKKIDILISEVGLGGTHDATNLVKKKILSIITSIDFDHTELLGKNLTDIAQEKEGIIFSGIPAVINTGHKYLDKLLIKKRGKENIYFLGSHFNYIPVNTDWKHHRQFFNYCGIKKVYKNLCLALLGQHQLKNACLAIAATEILEEKYRIHINSIRKALCEVLWPGRFQIINFMNKKFILDGAHNPAGIKVFKETLKSSPYYNNSKKVILVTSVMKEKDYKKIFYILNSVVDMVIIYKLKYPRALNPDVAIKVWRSIDKSKSVICMDNFKDVINIINKDSLVCITGSLYLVGEALKFFGHHFRKGFIYEKNCCRN